MEHSNGSKKVKTEITFDDSFLMQLDIKSALKKSPKNKVVVTGEASTSNDTLIINEPEDFDSVDDLSQTTMGENNGEYQDVFLSQLISQRDLMVEDDQQVSTQEDIVGDLLHKEAKGVVEEKLEKSLFDNVVKEEKRKETKRHPFKIKNPKVGIPDEIEEYVYVEQGTKSDKKRKKNSSVDGLKKNKSKSDGVVDSRNEKKRSRPPSDHAGKKFVKKRRVAIENLFSAQEEYEVELTKRVESSLKKFETNIRSQLTREFDVLKKEVSLSKPDDSQMYLDHIEKLKLDNAKLISNLQQEKEDIVKENSAFKDSFEKKILENDGLKIQLGKRDMAMKEMRNEYESKIAEIKVLKSKYQAEKESTQQSHDKEIMSLKTKYEAEKELSQQSHDIAIHTFKNTIETTARSLEHIKNEFSSIESEKNALENKILELQKTISNLHSKNTDLELKLENYKSSPTLEDYLISEEQRKSLLEIKKNMEAQIAEKNDELAKLRNDHNSCIEEKDLTIKKLALALREVHDAINKN